MSLDHDLLRDGGVRLDLDGPVATVTLDRPDRRNAQTPSTWRALAHLGRELPQTVRVVVLRGAGVSFSAGLDRRLIDGTGIAGEGDIPGLMALDDESVDRWIDECQAGFTWLRDPRFVSVAVVHGHAYGAGFQLALSCDYRVVTPEAAFCMKEVANALVAADALEDEVAAVVERFTAAPHGAVVGAKVLALAASEHDLHAQRSLERRTQLGRFRDLAAGLASD